MSPISFRSLLITGASSGIGGGLAVAFAAPSVQLCLLGRNPERLAEIAETCRKKGATVTTATINVENREAMREFLLAQDRLTPFDLIIANAGISGGTRGMKRQGGQIDAAATHPTHDPHSEPHGGESEAQIRAITEINIMGVMNTILPLIPALEQRGVGSIALMSSLAGFRGLPTAPSYCASKAWLRVWGEGLRVALAPQGIVVTVICPGFVTTPMTGANGFPMPMIWPLERAVKYIKQGLENGRTRIIFPWPMAFLVKLMAALPPGFVDYFLARLNKKSN